MPTVELAPKRDHRLAAYALLTAIAAGTALLTGQSGVMAIAAVALAAAVWTGRATEPLTVSAEIKIESRRLIEGDDLRFEVVVSAPVGHDVSATIVETSDALGQIEVYDVEHRDVDRGADMVLHCRVEAPSWGRYRLGQLAVRATQPGSTAVWQQRVIDLGRINVLPRQQHLDQMLSPAATQISAGRHLSTRSIGSGTEFAEIRGYQPGDRLRDVNWKATVRRQATQVNQRLPERGGDVVIVIDAVPDGVWHQSPIGRELLLSAGRASWALIQNHLQAQDRVGIVIHQHAGVEWLAPRGGRRARYRLMEYLLTATDPIETGQRSVFERHDIPKSALVVGISSLISDQTLIGLAALRTHGREVCVLAIDQTHVLRSQRIEVDTIRLALLFNDARIRYLRRLSTPVVLWRPGDDIDRSIRTLGELTRRTGRRAS